MYTKNGQEVNVLKVVGGGFLVAPLLERWGDDVYVEGPMMLVDEVFEQAPTARFDATVASLKEEIEELRGLRFDLNEDLLEAERQAEKRMAKFRQLEALQGLEDFIDGKVTHYIVDLRWQAPCIVDFADAKCAYDSRDKKLLTLFGDSKGNLTWKLNRYSDGSGLYSDVMPCLSHEEAVGKLTVLLHEKMEKVATRALAEHAEEQGVSLPDGYMERVEEASRSAKEKKIVELYKRIEELEQG